jgi:hypothetical protein
MTRGFGFIPSLALCAGGLFLPPGSSGTEAITSRPVGAGADSADSVMTGAGSTAGAAGPSEPFELLDLDRRFEAIRAAGAPFGEGGREVLEVAYRALREGRAGGRWPLVGLEDLWAEAIKEGAVLFNRPDRRWGLESIDETVDGLHSTAIGPWQITIRNLRHIYGRPYGVEPDWPDGRVYAFCRDHPEIQVRTIADYIQEAYEKYGRRGPYGIQRYFSLRAYVRGTIGLGRWDLPVWPAAPSGDPARITPAQKANTGFYAKQLLLGTRTQPHGLVYWLWVTGDLDAIREVLRVWRDQRCLIWDELRQKPLLTSTDGLFAIHPADLKYLAVFPECRAAVERLVREVLAEREQIHGLDRAASTGGNRPEGGVVHLEPVAGP